MLVAPDIWFGLPSGMHQIRLLRSLLALLLLCTLLPAQDYDAQSMRGNEISVEQLRTFLVPLRVEQLEVEAEAWLDWLQQVCRAVADAQEGGEGSLPALTVERKAGIDRFLVVVGAYEDKGGDADKVKIYRSYASTVGGLGIDDASAIWSIAVDWLRSPEGGISLGVNFLLFLLILFVFRILSRFLGHVVEHAIDRFGRTSELLEDFFASVTRKVVMFIGVVIAVSRLGVDIGPFLAAIGAAGFVIGFALQGTLSNFASGIMILLYRPYDIGDYVTIGGVTGTVEAMTLVSTSVKSPDNQRIVVPNSKIWGDIITNVTGKETRRIDMKFGIGYSDDIAKAESILTRLVKQHPLVLDDPEPIIKVHELADSSVNLIVRPWAKTSDYWSVYWDLTRQVKEAFDADGISIPFPQRDLHIRSQQ